MNENDIKQIDLLLADGLTLEQVAKEMGFNSYHTFRVRMLEAGYNIRQAPVKVSEDMAKRKELLLIRQQRVA